LPSPGKSFVPIVWRKDPNRRSNRWLPRVRVHFN
jgi:hypothetical protein